MPTATTIIAEVRDMLDEETAAQWTDTQLRKWINEGNRDLARSTRHIKELIEVTTTAGTGSYDLPASTLAVEHAWYNDVTGSRHLPLHPKHTENMDAIRGYDWDRAGTPQFFSTLGFSPSLQIQVFPVPTVTSDKIKMMVARIPASIATNGDDDDEAIEIPTAWYDALADYCEFKALRRDRDPRWQEAWNMYTAKRDGLIHNPDYIAVNRELIPDPTAGYLPAWLVEFD